MIQGARKDERAGVAAAAMLLVFVAAIGYREGRAALPGRRAPSGGKHPAGKKEADVRQQAMGVATGLAAAAVMAMASGSVAADAPAADGQCAMMRAPDFTGNYGATKLPTEWNEKSGKNIRWKTALPLQGWAACVVWGNRVVTTGADKEKRSIYGLDADTGKLAWTCDVTVNESAANDYVTDTMDERWNALCYAGATPATDGKRVVALFSNGQLVSADLATGKEQWQVVVGAPGDNKYGQTSALLIHKDTVILSFEGDGQFVAAFGLADGKELWRAKRKGATWASPILAKSGGKTVVVTASDPQVLVVNADTGTQVWSADLITDGVEYAYGPNPLVVGDMLVVAGERCGILGVPLAGGAKAWSHGKTDNVDKFSDGTPMATDGKHVFHYFGSYLTCVDAKTGKLVKEKDMGDESSYAAPFVADGKLYAFAKSATLICNADPASDFAPVGKGEIKDSCDGCAAIAGGCIYLRTDASVYCIGAK